MLQSHYQPDKNLGDHIAEVRLAAKSILRHHSQQVAAALRPTLEYAVSFHDLGKATEQFQAYIANPKMYKKPPEEKAHAPVSLFWWLAYAFDQKLDWQTITAVAAVVWQHHGNFPAYGGQNGLQMALGKYEVTLPQQLASYPIRQVASELATCLPEDADWSELDFAAEAYFYEHELETELNLSEAVAFRLRSQILFSILLEADRAMLALGGTHAEVYLDGAVRTLPNSAVVESFCQNKQATPLSRQQTSIRREVVAQARAGINTVTLPTGLGKTLIGAEWLLTNASSATSQRKCIIVLPFLSIIDQTATEYRSLFGPELAETIQEAHSLAQRNYLASDADDASSECVRSENRARDFLAEIWDSPVIITTFDQFLCALFSSKGRHLLKAHQLADALVVMDEIQAVPPALWAPLSHALNTMAEEFGLRALVMSATQPGFLEQAREAAPDPEAIFRQRQRYTIRLQNNTVTSIDEFCRECACRAQDEWQGGRVMLVLNTRRSARQVRDALSNTCGDMPLYFLSADVIPQERLDLIAKIREDRPCLVVATQCIEAGVDIDLNLIIRDFAPLDSIIQVAGRCNRRGRQSRGIVELVQLCSSNGKPFSSMIYDSILLQETKAVLSELTELPEEKTFVISTDYFERIRNKKDIGLDLLKQWAYWGEPLNVAKELGKDNQKYDFVVLSEDRPQTGERPLGEALENALAVEDRWERKQHLRVLAPRIARLSVSVWSRPGLVPEEISTPLGCWNILNDGYYEPGRGLVLEEATTKTASLIL
jgi:CRISPR-associated endonuclease/helicase Cas3